MTLVVFFCSNWNISYFPIADPEVHGKLCAPLRLCQADLYKDLWILLECVSSCTSQTWSELKSGEMILCTVCLDICFFKSLRHQFATTGLTLVLFYSTVNLPVCVFSPVSSWPHKSRNFSCGRLKPLSSAFLTALLQSSLEQRLRNWSVVQQTRGTWLKSKALCVQLLVRRLLQLSNGVVVRGS